MRNLIVNSFQTLDGGMQAPGGPEEDPTGGFTQGGWSVGYWDDMMGQIMGTYMSKPFDLLLGRKTYEIFAAHWPYAEGEPDADVLNNSTLVTGDVIEEIRKLKTQDGPEIQVHGSSNLIQILLKNDLIDEYRLW